MDKVKLNKLIYKYIDLIQDNLIIDLTISETYKLQNLLLSLIHDYEKNKKTNL